MNLEHFRNLFSTHRRLVIFFSTLIAAIVLLATLMISWQLQLSQQTAVRIAQLKLNTEMWQSRLLVKQSDLLLMLHYMKTLLYSKYESTPTTKLLQRMRLLWEEDGLEKMNAYSRQLWSEVNATNIQLFTNSSLMLPFTYRLLPHLVPTSLAPATITHSYRRSLDRTNVALIIGIPTILRDLENYLIITLHSLLSHLQEQDKERVLFVVHIGETDRKRILIVVKELLSHFKQELNDGMMDIIAPAGNYYMDFNDLLMDDVSRRLTWRIKTNLDFAYLMMYAQTRGQYYLQMGDDVIVNGTYVQKILDFAATQTAAGIDWLVLDFCETSSYGKLFKTSELPKLISFIFIFYADQPVDVLFLYYAQMKYCNVSLSFSHARCAHDSLYWLEHKPALFKHIGLHKDFEFRFF